MTGYVRQSVADIVTGEEITAPPLNAEFNRLQAAFSTTGHEHDGTAGNGPKLNLVTSITGFLPVANGGTGGRSNYGASTDPTISDNSNLGYVAGSQWFNITNLRMYILSNTTTNSAVWVHVPTVVSGNISSGTGTVDLGTTSSRFKNAYLSNTLFTQFIGATTLSGEMSAGSFKITNLGSPTATGDAATKNYVDTAIANLVNSAPGVLDTLSELATAIGNDPNFATTVTANIASKLPLAGGTMTGSITMGGNKVTGLGTPTAAGDAVNKTYTDTLFGSTSSAAASATAANNSKNYATEWANKAVDSLVSTAAGGNGTTDYSSRHHAAKALASASNATQSATDADGSATNSASSATAALNSQNAANTSAGNAATSESNALAYRNQAEGFKNTAGTSATNAGTSESNALTSRNQAETFKNNAQTSATNAANSASNAVTSANSASTSATTATNQKNYATEWANNAENVPVSTAAGGNGSSTYSSRHWAAKAAASAATVTPETGATIISKINQNTTDKISGDKVVNATDSIRGSVVLIDSVSSAANAIQSRAATPNSVKTAYDFAATKLSISAKATGAQLRALTDDTNYLTSKTHADAMMFTTTLIDFGVSIPPRMSSQGINMVWTLSANFGLMFPNGEFENEANKYREGLSGVMVFAQDATGGRTVTFGTGWDFGADGPPTIRPAANAVDYVFYVIKRGATSAICTYKAGA